MLEGLGLGEEGQGGGVGNDGNFLRSILQKALFFPLSTNLTIFFRNSLPLLLKNLKPLKVSQPLTSQETGEADRQQDLKLGDELEPHSSG